MLNLVSRKDRISLFLEECFLPSIRDTWKTFEIGIEPTVNIFKSFMPEFSLHARRQPPVFLPTQGENLVKYFKLCLNYMQI